MKFTLKQVKALAREQDWQLHDHQEKIKMISFVKIISGDTARINIYLSTATVATCINHPKKGKTQLFRKHVDSKLMVQIFKNPRIHTAKGYRTK